MEPHDVTDEHGTVRLATIETYGETLHTFVDRSRVHGRVPARLRGRSTRGPRTSGMLLGIDHIVGNVELGT